MNKIYTYIVAAAALCGVPAHADKAHADHASVAGAVSPVTGVSVSDVKMERNGDYFAVDMLLNLENLKVKSNRAVLLTPCLVNGNDSIDLPSIGVYGRRRYYHYVRNDKSMLTTGEEQSYRSSRRPELIDYNKLVPFKDWMNGATLTLRRDDYGCCEKLIAQQIGPLGQHVGIIDLIPELVYVCPEAEKVKSRALEGSAFIDFPVDKTVIYPEYRRNTAELGKIQATIDSVRDDKDVTITQVWLKGYASPESPYSHNRDLAIGRTAALKQYIQQLYRFDEGVIATDYEPEDWAGLRRYVEKSNLDHRTQILALIDSDLEPDAKERKIKKTYPEEYRFLLQNCYPALRHTDYRIAYSIRSYNDVKEIERIFDTHPQNLSLNEFYLLAQKHEPGTQRYSDIFETAVRMYPDDATANLNAANAAMQREDFDSAARYLAKAGDSPEAVYARGALAVHTENYDAARRYLEEAKRRGVKQAETTLSDLDKAKK